MRLAPLAALLLSGCAWFTGALDRPERFHVEQLEGRMTQAERDLLGGREPRIGIALSGGGVRSAFYVAGALEALYEKGILQRADIISTVSGGGYTGYWVYTSQATAEAEAQRRLDFGAPLFGAGTFPANMCHLVTHANFVTLPRMVGAAITGSSVGLYDRRIGEVFGINDRAPPSHPMTMTEMGSLARAGHPYLIVNATVNRAIATDWADGLYEFNGVGTRGAGRGEVLWSASDGGAIDYRRAVGISGAAFAPFLKQTIAEPPGATNGATTTLNDGGASENLGAIALIRRAVPTILIVDAEHDPSYEFGAYVNLKDRLPRWGANIVIPGIEAFLASGRRDSPDTSYFRGTVTGRRDDGSLFTSHIHYLKMSYGPTLRARLNEAWRDNDIGPPGWRDFNAARRSDRGCRALHGRDLGLPALFGYAVQHYGEWWNRRPRSRLLGGFLSLNFPQYSTGDQSMYVDRRRRSSAWAISRPWKSPRKAS